MDSYVKSQPFSFLLPCLDKTPALTLTLFFPSTFHTSGLTVSHTNITPNGRWGYGAATSASYCVKENRLNNGQGEALSLAYGGFADVSEDLENGFDETDDETMVCRRVRSLVTVSLEVSSMAAAALVWWLWLAVRIQKSTCGA